MNNKLLKCQEGITAAKQIYSSPSLFSLISDAFYPLISERFVYGSSVAYVYSVHEKHALYILLLYSLEKKKGHGTGNINQIKEYARKNNLDIIVTVSKKSSSSEAAKMFYEKNGFKYKGSDRLQHYYIIRRTDISASSLHLPKPAVTQKELYHTKDKIAIVLSLIAYQFRMRNSLPLVVEIMNEWFLQNDMELRKWQKAQ